MKKLLAALIFLVMWSTSIAQRSDLCQGSYYTEEQGAVKLAAVGNSLHTLKDWQNHADSIRRQIKKGMGLVSLPKKTPLNPRSRNKKNLNGYSVESIVFESIPGFYVTGNLYRPLGTFKEKSLAVILATHGHASQPENAGRFKPGMQARCAALARMGALVFAYDMIGYGESNQLPHKAEKTLLFQTWNSMRVIDYLLTFKEADPDRIAISGESGGGTQTFILAAVDDRVKVSVPVVMVSSYFFGGCECESGMPVHKTGNKVFSNAEIACLAAPRPMLLISDGADWTKNTETVEYPFAKKVYALYGQESKVENVHLKDEGHDYGESKRTAAYQFLVKHLNLTIKNITSEDGKLSEAFFTPLERDELIYFQSDELASLIKNETVHKVMANLRGVK